MNHPANENGTPRGEGAVRVCPPAKAEDSQSVAAAASNGRGIIIHRSRHAQQYVVIPNTLARNKTLSFRARGLLVMLLSLPPEWHVTTDQLADDNPDSRETIRRAMRELRDAGYVELHTEQDSNGRWRRRIEVYDTTPTERTLPAFGATWENNASPQVAPNAGKPAAGNTADKKKYGSSSARASTRGGRTRNTPPPAGKLCQRCGRGGHPTQWCPY